MVKPFSNPAFHEEPQSQPARIIPPRDNESLYQWIKDKGRFKEIEIDEEIDASIPDELEDIMQTAIYKLEEEDEEIEEEDFD
ncbi:MAG TPA: DUF3134 family protein [Leptolyngbyaceae cyanobacterium]